VQRDPKTRDEQRLSVMTLIIGSVSSAAAAVIVHELWRTGSIIGAAATPVLMTLIAEALRRPAERVTVRPALVPARWRLAVLTGLAAFVLGAAGLTAAEALLERSVADGHAGTTLFDTRPQPRSATSTDAGPPARLDEPARYRRRPPKARTQRQRIRAGAQVPSPTPVPTPTPSPAVPPAQPTPTPAPTIPIPSQTTPPSGTS
jgi:hypothetical protein